MKLRTSFFNGSVLKKDITRFFPIWVLYGIFLLLVVALGLSHQDAAGTAVKIAEILIPAAAVVNLIYAPVCALVLFSDLYASRMCNALHAMPLRRECWFATHAGAGLLFSLVPNLVAVLVTLPLLGSYWEIGFLWLAASELQFLFFFGCALFCIMCAGNALGMLAMYGILNFASLIFLGIINTLYTVNLKGVCLDARRFCSYSPVCWMVSGEYTEISWTEAASGLTVPQIIRLLPAAWEYLGITAAIGLVLAGLALLLYRSRQLERAGDLLAVRWIIPIFHGIFSLGAGVLLYLFSWMSSDNGNNVFLYVGLAIGFFVGEMLLRKSVKVFRVKTVVTYILAAAVLGLSIFVCSIDPLDVVYRIPEPERIRSASANITWNARLDAEKPEDIERVRQLHQLLLDQLEQESGDGNDGASVDVTYELTNGRRMLRSYWVNTDTSAADMIREIMSDWKVVTGTESPEALLERISQVRVYRWDDGEQNLWVPKDQLPELIEAIAADCAAHTMYPIDGLHHSGSTHSYLEIQYRDRALNIMTIGIDVYRDNVHTAALLDEILK